MLNKGYKINIGRIQLELVRTNLDNKLNVQGGLK